MEFELVEGVKVDDGSCFGGGGVAGMTFGVLGRRNGAVKLLPLELGLGLPLGPSYFPLTPGEFP